MKGLESEVGHNDTELCAYLLQPPVRSHVYVASRLVAHQDTDVGK